MNNHWGHYPERYGGNTDFIIVKRALDNSHCLFRVAM